MLKEIHHIYWFAHFGLKNPSVRYRGLLPLQFISKNHDVTSDFIYPEKKVSVIIKFIRIYLSALVFRKPGSLVVIQKVTSNRFYANALKVLIFLRRKNTLYDIDDAEYIRNNTRSLHYFLKNCETVSVGSKKLFEYCSYFNSNTFILTTPIYSHKYKNPGRNGRLHMGWIGDPGNGNPISSDFSHRRSLFKLIFPAFRKLNLPFKLSLIGISNPDDIVEIEKYFSHYPTIDLEIPDNLKWEDDEWAYSSISDFDLGLALMVDHPFNRAKSAFKAKQYLSCGVPVLASDVGENRNFVKHGFNGFICNDEDDIIKYLIRVSDMQDEEYDKMKRNARESTIIFSLENYCRDLLKQVSIE